MKLYLQIPSKTFILGEYLALWGGPSLVANTRPCFQTQIYQKNSHRTLFHNQKSQIHPKSPAGVWVEQHMEDFWGVEMDFLDPHLGSGGFGASTAQFLSVYFWSQWKRGELKNKTESEWREFVWQEYRKLATSPLKPSGSDLMSQMMGGVSYFQWSEEQILESESFDWPFESQSFCLFRTGTKVSTHEHLAKIEQELNEEDKKEMESILISAKNSLNSANAFDFLLAIQSYAKILEKKQWVAPSTQNWIKDLYQSKNILGVKGCGALGADVLLVLCESDSKESVLALAKAVGLSKVATETDLTKGMSLSMSWSSFTSAPPLWDPPSSSLTHQRELSL